MAPGVFVIARRFGLRVVALAALAACAPKTPPPSPRGPPTVGVVTLATMPVDLANDLPGRTSPYETSDVRPQVAGIVTARLFKEGADVRRGQVLYQIDPAPYRAAVDQARAQVANAEANLATTKVKAERYADLVKINAVARQDYDDATAAFRQAAATVQQQQAALNAAAINLGYTRVTAPISGRIGRSAVTTGGLATVGQATAFTTIQRLDPIYVDLTQSAAEVLRLRQAVAAGKLGASGPSGVPVRLKLEDGSDYPLAGRLEFTDVTVDQTTGAVTLRARFPNPRGLLLPGLYVRAVIVEAVARDAILAPQQGVSRNEKGDPTALVVDGRGRAQARSLTLGRALGDKWLVTSGLAAGDRLIVEGLQSVKPGLPVHAVPFEAAAPAATASTR